LTLAVDGLLAMNAMFINLYTPGGYGNVPFLAYALADGDYAKLSGALLVHLINSGTAEVMHLSIVCSDDPVASLEEVRLDGVADIYRGVIVDDAEDYISNCKLLGLPQLPSTSDEMNFAGVPALLLQGGMDPETPVEGGNLVAATLPNSHNIVFPDGTHIQAHRACAVSILDAFLADPTAALDTSCINQTLTFSAPRPAGVTSVDGGANMTVTLPAGLAPGSLPGQWTDGSKVIALLAYDAGSTVEDAIVKTLADVPIENPTTVVGPVIAGHPSQLVQGVLNQNVTQYIDAYFFSDGKRAYRIIFDITDSAALDELRETLVQPLLASVTISGD